MNVELQRRIFEAEDHYIDLKAKQEKFVESYRRFFAVAVVLLLFGTLSPFLFLRSPDPEINRLVGFATGALVLMALVALTVNLVLWRRVTERNLLRAEMQLVTAQKSFVQKYMGNVTQQNLIELGFPRTKWERTDKRLGSTVLENEAGVPKLFELYYSPSIGYSIEVRELEKA